MKKIIIIGGGIAGLSAGIFAQKNGFESTIYEKHTIVGGECTGWERVGHDGVKCHIDGCIQWMTGTLPGTSLYELWCEVAALGDGVELIHFDSFVTFECDGETITLWRDLDRFERETIALAPGDEKEIRRFCKAVRAVGSMEMPVEKPMDMMGPFEMMKLGSSMMGAGAVMTKYGKISGAEYAQRFRHPVLRKMFQTLLPEEYSASAMIFSYATFVSGNGAYPKGGSRAMALRMEERYRSLGGKVVTGAKAAEILIEGDRATGVRFADGTVQSADYVVAACDTNVTFQKLLQGRQEYMSEYFRSHYAHSRDYALSACVYASYETNEDLSAIPRSLCFCCEPYRVAEKEHDTSGIYHYSFDPTLNPAGKDVIVSYVPQMEEDYFYWKELSADPAAYRAEKERVQAVLLERIEQQFPALAGKVHPLDCATPVTYERYLGAFRGAYMSFMLTPKGSGSTDSDTGELKGLDNCYLTGQWLQATGGLPTAVSTGKFTIQRICKKENQNFRR